MAKVFHSNEKEPYGGKKAFAEKYGLPLEIVEQMSIHEMDDYVIDHIQEARLNAYLDDIDGIGF